MCWKCNVVGCKQSRFLDGTESNFLILNGPSRGEVQLDLLYIHKEELVGAQDPEKSEERKWQSRDPGH